MGQHKHNPTAILAKEGKISPKKHNMGKPELQRRLNAIAQGFLWRRFLMGR
jgi:hypothetical protein